MPDYPVHLPDGIAYERTDDPNVFKRIEQVESEIHLDELEGGIADLEADLANIPRPKAEPDQETLDFWNMHGEMGFDEEGLTTELAEKRDLLERLRRL